MSQNEKISDTSVQKRPWWIIFLGWVLFVAIILPIGFFIFFFYDHPWSSSLADWSSFGSYIGGVLSPVLALVGMYITVILAYLSNKSEKENMKLREMEVKPLANIPIGNYIDEVEVKIENAGMGPLIINSVKVSNIYGNNKPSLIEWFPSDEFDNIIWSGYIEHLEGIVIGSNSSIILLKLSNQQDKSYKASQIYKVKQKLSGLTIEVEYKDIYNKQLPTMKRSLEWFGERNNHKKRH